MKASGLMAMAVAAASFVGAQKLQKPAQTPVLNQQTRQGCFKSVGNMTESFSGTDTSSGYCFGLCKKKYNTFALQGSKCYCGMLYPPEDDLVDDSKCNWPCPGYGDEACGALKTYYSVFNTGLELAPDNYKPEASTTSAAPSSTKAAESTTAGESSAAAGTQDAAATSEAPSDEKKDDGPNVAAIAAGVVVGVVVVAAIGGGAIFFVRRRRNAEIEEEHRRNAAVNAFINGSKPPGSSGSISMTDSRLDPVMAHRRLSDGSIADNQDYSRRILRVTNA
ncbi:cell wall integrity and stress response component 1 [Fusarium beomiforme]|uniref:Cell wall integrity and stress response component 1 n=1 Tax=Fusarium beomiforme TaxID=44412 RepID=A0A9P5AAL6_9HYPO|nr:cell wall integrity and stress response component 1 [Fusarium beomiforme]